MPSVSMVCGPIRASASWAAAVKASVSGQSSATMMPGLVQNWPAPIVRLAAQPSAIWAARLVSASGSRNTGFGAKLAKEGDRIGALRAKIKQCAAPAKAAGKAHGADQRVLHKGFAHIAFAALNKAEHAHGHIAGMDSGQHSLRHDLARAGMGGVALDDHRATSGQGAGGIAARNREGEREV